MKKIIFLIATIALTLSLFILPASAVEADAGTDAIVDTEPTEPPEAEAEQSNTQMLSAWITDHLGDITGSISSVGLLILSWLISKKLIPAVKDAVTNVATKSAAYEGVFKDKVDSVASSLADGVKRLEGCEKRISEEQGALQKRIEANAKAYELQTDLINYLFLNLRVPNDLKTEVAKKSEEIKAAIKEANEG